MRMFAIKILQTNPVRSLSTCIRYISIFAVAGVVGLFSASAIAESAPEAAAENNFLTNTFSSSLNQNEIDLAKSGNTGFRWYLGQFFSTASMDEKELSFPPSGGVVIGGTGDMPILGTAEPVEHDGGWVGTAFGGGGYFEAQLKFNPDDTLRSGDKDLWPAFWSMAIEHLANLKEQQWPGQAPGYVHFAEPDFFEYDRSGLTPQNYYGGAFHEWYGKWDSACGPNTFCSVSNMPRGQTSYSNFKIGAPFGTDFNVYHKFGFLWVPATTITNGRAQYFFDDKLTSDVISWKQYSGQQPPPGKAPWTFGIIDQQHLVLFLQTGSQEPMAILSVNVWQNSAADNLTR
jgi:hypothetical protein